MSVGLRVVSSLTLARLLFPEDYGPFIVCSAIVGLGQYLCDVGIGTYLVVQDHEPTKKELTTAFWLLMLLTTVVVVGIVGLTPLLLAWYAAKPEYSTMLMVMAVGLYLPMLRVIPRIVLDRALRFPDVARGDLAENVLQVIVGIVLAAMGKGPWALVISGLVGRFANLVFTWAVSPFRPGTDFSRELMVGMVRNGLRFHVNVVTPVAIRSGGPLILSRGLGETNLGLVGWATNQAAFVVMISSLLNQIALPTYSRMRADPEQMGRSSTAMALRVGVLLSALVAPLVVAAPVLIELVFTKRWIAAAPVFQWLLLEAVVTIVVGLHQQAQTAAGRLKDAFVAAVVGNIGRLVFLFIGVYIWGLAGAGPGYYVGALFDVGFLAWQLRRNVTGCEGAYRATFLPVLSLQLFALIAVVVGHLLMPGSVMGAVAIGLVVLAALVLLFDRLAGGQPITSELRGVLRMLKARG
jgi:PST family polysaccharide transporter